MNDVVLLVKQQRGVDDYGDPTITETFREVYCKTESIGQTEFYQSAALGLKPEMKLVLQDYYDYEDELILDYDGIRYRVLRTFRKGQRLELVCTRELNADGLT